MQLRSFLDKGPNNKGETTPPDKVNPQEDYLNRQADAAQALIDEMAAEKKEQERAERQLKEDDDVEEKLAALDEELEALCEPKNIS